jgi:hypothetical protein
LPWLCHGFSFQGLSFSPPTRRRPGFTQAWELHLLRSDPPSGEAEEGDEGGGRGAGAEAESSSKSEKVSDKSEQITDKSGKISDKSEKNSDDAESGSLFLRRTAAPAEFYAEDPAVGQSGDDSWYIGDTWPNGTPPRGEGGDRSGVETGDGDGSAGDWRLIEKQNK